MASQAQRKADFVRYQRSFRQAAGQDVLIHLEWRRKTTNQRRAWHEARQRVEAAVQARDTAWSADEARSLEEGGSIAIVREIEAIIDRNVRDLARLNKLIRRARKRYRDLRDLTEEVANAWQTLATLEQSQKRSVNDDSVRHAQDRATNKAQRVAQMDAQLARFRRERKRYKNDKQDVPVDDEGRELVPEAWLGKDMDYAAYAARKAIYNDVKEQRLGHKGQEDYEWIPWIRIGDLASRNIDGWIWLLFDSMTDTIIDRVFVKNCIIDEGEWSDARRFDGDVKDPTSKVPWEIACHDSLMDVQDLDNVVPLRERLGAGGCMIDPDLMTYRLYLEYCPFGDLAKFISGYEERGDFIPEPFIWYVAEILADCGVAMARGTVGYGRAPADWRQIVHRDIKPDNVFLTAPSRHRFAWYPKPVLADFGLAFRTSDNDPNNPRWYNGGAGTEGFKAPEQFRMIDRKQRAAINTWRLDEKTNVYAIGVTLHCLLMRKNYPDQPVWLGNGTDAMLYPIRLPARANDTDFDESTADPTEKHARSYSGVLRDLINECLEYRPQDRPTARRLQEKILEIVQTPVEDSDEDEMTGAEADNEVGLALVKHIRDESDVDEEDPIFERAHIRVVPEQYANGMARVDLPPKHAVPNPGASGDGSAM